mmetsp:Transcript_25053/g.70144  ORF Transcript_25053/g.70144 Transcript_25053/m.70144 type:complete len:557 (-) Transcript_25053:343-2013(-)
MRSPNGSQHQVKVLVQVQVGLDALCNARGCLHITHVQYKLHRIARQHLVNPTGCGVLQSHVKVCHGVDRQLRRDVCEAVTRRGGELLQTSAVHQSLVRNSRRPEVLRHDGAKYQRTLAVARHGTHRRREGTGSVSRRVAGVYIEDVLRPLAVDLHRLRQKLERVVQTVHHIHVEHGLGAVVDHQQRIRKHVARLGHGILAVRAHERGALDEDTLHGRHQGGRIRRGGGRVVENNRAGVVGHTLSAQVALRNVHLGHDLQRTARERIRHAGVEDHSCRLPRGQGSKPHIHIRIGLQVTLRHAAVVGVDAALHELQNRAYALVRVVLREEVLNVEVAVRVSDVGHGRRVLNQIPRADTAVHGQGIREASLKGRVDTGERYIELLHIADDIRRAGRLAAGEIRLVNGRHQTDAAALADRRVERALYGSLEVDRVARALPIVEVTHEHHNPVVVNVVALAHGTLGSQGAVRIVLHHNRTRHEVEVRVKVDLQKLVEATLGGGEVRLQDARDNVTRPRRLRRALEAIIKLRLGRRRQAGRVAQLRRRRVVRLDRGNAILAA